MTRCIIFGGTGYVGSMIARGLAESGSFGEIVLADHKPLPGPLPPRTRFVPCDVRGPIAPHVVATDAQWIFNVTALHDAAAQKPRDVYDTHLYGARNVCAFAGQIGCPNLVYASSTEVYGPTQGIANEDTPKYPATPAGASLLCSELMHETWVKSGPGRRLIVVRPGTVYGPGERGDIWRLIAAARRGILVLPGSAVVRRSYSYIYGLLESLEFAMGRGEPILAYNYVEAETETIGTLVRIIRATLGAGAATITLPLWVLTPAAAIVQRLTHGRSAFDPARLREAARDTWIAPAKLKHLGFEFRYDFATSLRHWRDVAPGEF